VAVVYSRFPVWNQTFALGDFLALDRAGYHIEILTLRGGTGSFEQPETQTFQGRVHRAFYRSWSLWRENLKAWCRPLTWRLFGQLVAGTFARPTELFKTCLLFPQAIYFAHLITRRGMQHIHAAWASYPATAAWIASELTDIPFSFTGHAYDIYMVRSLLQEKMQRAQFVVTCAETNRDELVRIGGEDMRHKIHVHRHGVDLKRFQHPMVRPKPQPVWQLLACGFLASYKGFAHLVSACELLHQQGCKFHCTIIGEGPEHGRLTRQIQQARLSSQVQLLPPIPQSELVKRYHQADVFIHPSVVTKQGNRDVIPNVLAEAMASGVPVISTRLAGIQELIQADENGLLVTPGDPQALAEAVVNLMQDDKKRQRLVEAAKQSVTEAFDRHRNAEELVRTFATYLPF
jgi:glycosyltransferase involved in cell wall biosynthesis